MHCPFSTSHRPLASTGRPSAHASRATIDRLSKYEGMISASADRKSTRLNSSHSQISYAVFCLKKKRVPPEGEARANLHVGGRAVKTGLTPRERDICAAIGPSLREQGLVFVGIDVIGDYMSDIDVTSPTGLQEIARLDGTDLAAPILVA